MAKKTIISAGGVGESKVFAAPEGTFNDDPILNLHVGGVLVSEMLSQMDPAMAAIVKAGLRYDATDEGIDARNEGKSENRVSVGSEGFDKALQQRRDDVNERDMESFEARDPLKEVADQYARPGMRAKFLSPRRVKENGGTGDYQVVKDGNGDTVTVKGMVLGHIPESRAIARNRHYQQKSNTLLKQITQKYKQEGGETAVADQ